MGDRPPGSGHLESEDPTEWFSPGSPPFDWREMTHDDRDRQIRFTQDRHGLSNTALPLPQFWAA
ncbi:MAG: hypothetical protein CMJ67_01720 [Planctomycetaceae bacterium]|nr:hypothetical protein [Planctomycetaceae bacterium]